MEREVSEVDRKLLLKKTYLDKINYHLTRNPINQEELYPIVRHFFGEYLKLDYEFTYEELSQELNKVFIRPKVKEHIDNFLIRLSESEYLEEDSLGSVEINAFLSELADIIMNIISEEQAAIQEEDSLIHRMLKMKHKETKVIDLAGVSALIDELNFHITSGNLDSSKRLYVDVLKTYDGMPKDDKKKLHESMNEVYDRLQTLMKNPKSGGRVQQQPAQPLEASETFKNVTGLAEETSFYINASNLDAAKKLYSDTLKLYDSLKPDEKKVLHPRLNELYTQLQSLSSKPRPIRVEAASLLSDFNKNKATVSKTETSASQNSVATKDISIGDKISPATPPVTSNSTTGVTSPDVSRGITSPISTGVSGASSVSATQSESAFASASSTFTPTFVGESNATAQRDVTNITDAGNTFDYSIDKLSDNAQSLADEEIDAYRRPLAEDKPLTEGFDKPIADSVSLGNIDFSLGGKTDKTKSSSKSSDVQSSDSPFTKEIDTFGTSKSDVGNVLFSLGKGTSSESRIEPKIEIKAESKSELKAESKHKSKSLPKSSSHLDLDMKAKASVPTLPSIPVSVASVAPVIPTTPVVSTTPIIPKIPVVVEDVKSKAVTSKLTVAVKQPPKLEVSRSIPAPVSKSVEKLRALLSRINDDVSVDKVDKAKDSYKEALIIYRSLKDDEKSLCYDSFYSTFKSLDNVLHQKSLHNILEAHLSESKRSQRSLISKDVEEHNIYTPESDKISKNTTLPVMINADEETTRVYELIEESYFNMSNNNYDLAMLKYFKALELYHKLPVADKKTSYHDLYNLFKKLSILKTAAKI
jgi:hypothetical protein